MGIKEVREVLINLNKKNGVTILVSSHILGELSQLANCYGFLKDGKIIEEISSDELNVGIICLLRLTIVKRRQ